MGVRLGLAFCVSMLSVTAMTLMRFGLRQSGAISGGLWAQPAQFVRQVLLQPCVLTGILIQGVGMLVWLTLLSRERLGVAVGLIGGVFYILSGLSSMIILGESLGVREWAGLVLVTGGVVLLSGGAVMR